MPRPTLSEKQKKLRREWKYFFRAVLDSSPRPLGATEIAQAATRILRDDLKHPNKGISPSQVSHWRSDPETVTPDLTLRVPSSEAQANALAYALAHLGAWGSDEHIERAEMKKLVEQLGYRFQDLADIHNTRWNVLSRVLEREFVAFLSAKKQYHPRELELINSQKARQAWIDLLRQGTRWMVISGRRPSEFSEHSGARRPLVDWPYEFRAYSLAIARALDELGSEDGEDVYRSIVSNLVFSEIQVDDFHDRFCNPDSEVLVGANFFQPEASVRLSPLLEASDWFLNVGLLNPDNLIGVKQYCDDGAAFGYLPEQWTVEAWRYVVKKLTEERMRFFSLLPLERLSRITSENLGDAVANALRSGQLFVEHIEIAPASRD